MIGIEAPYDKLWTTIILVIWSQIRKTAKPMASTSGKRFIQPPAVERVSVWFPKICARQKTAGHNKL